MLAIWCICVCGLLAECGRADGRVGVRMKYLAGWCKSACGRLFACRTINRVSHKGTSGCAPHCVSSCVLVGTAVLLCPARLWCCWCWRRPWQPTDNFCHDAGVAHSCIWQQKGLRTAARVWYIKKLIPLWVRRANTMRVLGAGLAGVCVWVVVRVRRVQANPPTSSSTSSSLSRASSSSSARQKSETWWHFLGGIRAGFDATHVRCNCALRMLHLDGWKLFSLMI